MNYVPWHERKTARAIAEQGIVKELISNLVDAGYMLAIDNGGDWGELELEPSTDKEEIYQHICLADYDNLVTYKMENGETLYHGAVVLIWGNEPYELIADYNRNLEKVIRPALDKAEAEYVE